jgi:CBS domain-containing protein
MATYGVPVRNYMHLHPLRLCRSDRVHSADERMRTGHVTGLAVVDANGKPLGVVSETDLLRLGSVRAATGTPGRHRMLPDYTLAEVMHAPAVCVSIESSLHSAVQAMRDHDIERVLVVDTDGRLCGIVSAWDALRRVFDARVGLAVRQLMSRAFGKVVPTQGAASAIEQLRKSRAHGLVVLDGDWPVGVFAQREALAAETADRTGPVAQWQSSALLCLQGELPCYRAAAQAIENASRYLVVLERDEVVGLLTPRDLLGLS